MTNPSYRNNRKHYYQEKGPDTVSIGTVINVFKTKDSSNNYDESLIPSSFPLNNATAYSQESGNANPDLNPEYQYYGYLYCDGSEYSINDYPLLFEQIGNLYGGTASSGIDIIDGGSGYSDDTEIVFSTPTGDGALPAQALLTIESGEITGVTVTFPGVGYTSEPTFTFTNDGGGNGFDAVIRIDRNGQIAPIAKNNVLDFWPDPYMGTFKVPDLKAKKLVGFGPVYGSGTPSIGNVDTVVGTTGGQWYLTKESQKNYFNLGNVRTTGYTDVVGTTNGRITGSVNITVTIDDEDLPGPPQHSHLLYHSEAPNLQGFPGTSIQIDPYMTGYRTRTGRINPFNPTNNLKLTHSHALSKERITGQNVATYDVYNYTGGDSGPGTVKENGNYYASGASGSFQTVTFTPYPLATKFQVGSLVGGKEVITDGTPVFDYNDVVFNTPGTTTYSLDVDVDEVQIFVTGGAGSGGVYDDAGNDGTASIVKLGNGSALTITSAGGGGGLAATTSSGGGGGNAGSVTISGTLSSEFSVSAQSDPLDFNYTGKKGGDGQLWFVANPDGPPVDEQTGESLYLGKAGVGGSVGKYLTVSGTANGSQLEREYPSSGTWTVTPTDVNKYETISATIRIYGARGADCTNFGGSASGGISGCTTGAGGSGYYMELGVNPDENGSLTGVYGFYPGQAGVPIGSGQANVTFGTAKGGQGGTGHTQPGGGGGAATIVTTTSSGGSAVVVAGCGGGGGGGGAGEGQCGTSGRPNLISADAQEVTVALFSGAGGYGGDYGCTGGGGGGGGGGIGTSGQTGTGETGEYASASGGNGGEGGGGGGSGGHGGGYGGRAGLSSVNTNYFTLNSEGLVNHASTSGSNGSGTYNGKIVGFTTESRNYYSSAAGGGGSGGYVSGTIFPSTIIASGASSLEITVGSGGSGVTNSINRTVDAATNWTELSGSVSSDDADNGQVLIREATLINTLGGTTTLTVGDIVVKGSDGIEIYDSGTGSGDAGGFALPVTQVPLVVVEAQGDGPGFGASATAVVTGSVVSSINMGAGGAGYTSPPTVRFLGGAGHGTQATVTMFDAPNQDSVQSISLVPGSSSAYTRYVKFGGADRERYIIITGQDCSEVVRFGVKAARGNNINGGERPDESADDLRVYYNTDGSLNFPESNFIGVLVERPTQAEIDNEYDGTGTGSNPTNWYNYYVDLPNAAKTQGVRFKIVQNRNAAAGNNDTGANGGNTDHYGICDFIYEYESRTETQFVASPGELTGDSRQLTYTIEGNGNAQYPAGIEPSDVYLNLTAGTPIVPQAALDPQTPIPLIEPYALTKHLIKAF